MRQFGALAVRPPRRARAAMPTPRSDDDPILLAADHNGVAVKQRIKEHLVARGRRCLDLGPFAPEPKVDYCDYAFQLGHIVDAGEARRGILVCGTGVGMSIVANRFARVRAALVHNLTTSMKSREHNDANVLCLGAWITAPDETLEIVDHWIDERFGEGRHVRRLEKIAPHDPKARVLTYGIFDLVNAAHIELLKFAKSLGGRLIVGINSDAAVRALRGPDAPVNREGDRKKVVESLIEVDEAIVFEE